MFGSCETLFLSDEKKEIIVRCDSIFPIFYDFILNLLTYIPSESSWRLINIWYNHQITQLLLICVKKVISEFLMKFQRSECENTKWDLYSHQQRLKILMRASISFTLMLRRPQNCCDHFENSIWFTKTKWILFGKPKWKMQFHPH